jgi:hypothetical protein
MSISSQQFASVFILCAQQPPRLLVSPVGLSHQCFRASVCAHYARGNFHRQS